jgi:hypothetical protein
MRKFSLLRKSTIKNLPNSLKLNNSQNSTKNQKPSLRKKPSKRKSKRRPKEKITQKCIENLWWKTMLEMELIVEAQTSRLLLTNKLNRTMQLIHSQDLVTCQIFLMLNQKTKKLKRKK